MGVAEADAMSEACHFVATQRLHFGLHLATWVATHRTFSTFTSHMNLLNEQLEKGNSLMTSSFVLAASHK